MNSQRFECPWCKTNHRWHSVDAHFWEVLVISSLQFLRMKAAKTSIIAWYRRTAVWLSMKQVQKMLTLRWRSFLRDSSDVNASIFGLKGGKYFDYMSQQPCLLFEYQTHKTKNRWRGVDDHFQDWSTSVSLSCLPIKTANTIPLEECDYAAIGLPKI